MNTFRFLEFSVYIQAKQFYKDIRAATKSIKQWSIKDQIERAGLSVVLNIAEGSAKRSDKEFARFLETAIGSVNEVVAVLDVMREIQLIESTQHKQLLSTAESIARQLGGFMKRLLKS